MKILLDGTEIENMENQQPKEYLNVKIYTGNPWNTPANAQYAQKNGLAMEEVVSNIFTPQPIGIQPKTTAYNIK